MENNKFNLSLEDIEVILKILRIELGQVISTIGVKGILVGIKGKSNFSNLDKRVSFLVPVKIVEDGDVPSEEAFVKILTAQIIGKLTVDHPGESRVLQSNLKLDSSKILEIFLKNEIYGEYYLDDSISMVRYTVRVGFRTK